MQGSFFITFVFSSLRTIIDSNLYLMYDKIMQLHGFIMLIQLLSIKNNFRG